MRAALLAIVFAQAILAESTADKAFKLFKNDVKSYVTEPVESDAQYRALAIRNAKPSVASAIRDECAKRRCRKAPCKHARMTSYVESAMRN